MRKLRSFVMAGLVGGLLLLSAGEVLHAEKNISGTIASTLIISEDTRLTGNVTCTVVGAPCIAFGAPGITLYLNGFTMTGLADATTGCSGTSVAGERGISTNGQTGVGVSGPGVVQRFRFSGIIFLNTVNGQINYVTATNNCASGIEVAGTSSNVRVEANVFVRNGQPNLTCGGICITSSNNKIRWNETSGNGYFGGLNDNWGIGIVSGNNNLVEGNTAIGNTNGIVLYPAATNTRVEGNVCAGNPPIQLSVNLPGSTGVDILNRSASGTSTFGGNLCVSGVNAPCPGLATAPIPRKPQN